MEDEESLKRTKEEEGERLKRKKMAEEESQRKKMQLIMAQRQMEAEFRKKQVCGVHISSILCVIVHDMFYMPLVRYPFYVK